MGKRCTRRASAERAWRVEGVVSSNRLHRKKQTHGVTAKLVEEIDSQLTFHVRQMVKLERWRRYDHRLAAAHSGRHTRGGCRAERACGCCVRKACGWHA